jgi:hypothetical protein
MSDNTQPSFPQTLDTPDRPNNAATTTAVAPSSKPSKAVSSSTSDRPSFPQTMSTPEQTSTSTEPESYGFGTPFENKLGHAIVSTAKTGRALYRGAVGDEETPEERGTTTAASPVAGHYGFEPQHMAHSVGELGHGIYQYGKGVVQDLSNKNMPIVSPNEPGAHNQGAKPEGQQTFIDKYIGAPSEAERQKALSEAQQYHDTHGATAFGHLLNTYVHTAGEAVPIVGPFAASLIDKAESGDVGGALAQTAALYAAPKA